ncbi:hypothetical protein Hanom_Chr15g01383751 [Helianthus anomalus]
MVSSKSLSFCHVSSLCTKAMNTIFYSFTNSHQCHDFNRGKTYDFFTHGIQDQRWWHLVELLTWRYTMIRGKSDPIYSLMTSRGI